MLRKTAFLFLLGLALFLTSPSRSTAAEPDIYDTKADGKQQIATAVTVAKKENKHVLLDFGANWCPWCHMVHRLFETDQAVQAKLNSSFVVVMIDTDKGRNDDVNLRYGSPTLHGLPVLVVLDSDGRQIFTQDTGAFEKGRGHDPVKVLAFLNKW